MPDLAAEWLLPVRRCVSHIEDVVVRHIPPSAEVLVQVDERVSATQPIARLAAGRGTDRQLHVVDVAGALELPGRDLSPVMLKRRGDAVQAGEMLAVRSGRLPFLYRPCRAPVGGRIVAMTHGWVVIETANAALDILAMVAGQVVEVTAGRSIAIQYVGALLEGAYGAGGLAVGTLYCSDGTANVALSPEHITEAVHATILVTPGCATREIVECAVTVGVAGIVAGSLSVDLAGAAPLTVIATEGYGRLRMAVDRFNLLNSLVGREATLVAPADDTWRGRPATVFVADAAHSADEDGIPAQQSFDRPVRTGDRVCAVRAPFAGRPGRAINTRPVAGQTPIAGGLQGLQVRFESNAPADPEPDTDVQWVPWLNLERIG